MKNPTTSSRTKKTEENGKKEMQPSLDGANKADSTRSDGAKTKVISLRPDEEFTHVKNITKNLRNCTKVSVRTPF